MVGSTIDRLLFRLAERICVEPRGDIGRNGEVYLRRWTLRGRRMGPPGSTAVFLHQFLRGDWDDALHDHPWPFTSYILKGGYYEVTPGPGDTLRKIWYHPGRVLIRKATHRHRVEIPEGRTAWTLVFRGVKERSWFFYCLRDLKKSIPWKSFVDNVQNSAVGCGEAT